MYEIYEMDHRSMKITKNYSIGFYSNENIERGLAQGYIIVNNSVKENMKANSFSKKTL